MVEYKLIMRRVTTAGGACLVAYFVTLYYRVVSTFTPLIVFLTGGLRPAGPAVGLSLAVDATRIGAWTRDSRIGSMDVLGAGVVSIGRFFPGLLLEGGLTLCSFRGAQKVCLARCGNGGFGA